MLFQTVTCQKQINSFLDFYEDHERTRAAELFVLSIKKSFRLIETGPTKWREYPSTYKSLKVFGFRWIFEHRYWFGYQEADVRIVTNVLFDTSDIPNLIAGIDQIIDMEW
ncbi:MAG: hypothetical protein WCC64_20630 [Aliidongia sp.]